MIALAKDDQSIQNYYAYSPYGETQALGVDEGNPVQYTARENDRTGLYFYRARYYDPILKRFISEDPIGFAGGANFYSYVSGNPASYGDPTGSCGGLCVVVVAVGVGLVITGTYAKKGYDQASARSENLVKCAAGGNDAACGEAIENEKQMIEAAKQAVEAGHETAQGAETGPPATDLWIRVKNFCKVLVR